MNTTFLDRREASAYLKEKRGLTVSAKSFSKWATCGGGPLYRIFCNKAVYLAEDLDAWADAKMSAPRRTTSEVQ